MAEQNNSMAPFGCCITGVVRVSSDEDEAIQMKVFIPSLRAG